MTLPSSGNLRLTDIHEEYGYDIREFSSGADTTSAPSGTIAVLVEAWGGGGGGSGAYNNGLSSLNGHGGGSGGYCARVYIGSTSVTWSIGSGGNGGSESTSSSGDPDRDGDSGTQTTASFAGFSLVAGAGSGATGSTFGNGGSASGGSINISGNSGQLGDTESGGASFGGPGGPSVVSSYVYYSGSGSSVSSHALGVGVRGAGGQGGYRYTNAPFPASGVNGASGMVRITFVGNFGPDNLSSYTRTSSSTTARTGTGQVVPNVAANSSVGTTTPISINDFRGGEGAWNIVNIPLSVSNNPSSKIVLAPPETFTITASATGGVSPYTYNWTESAAFVTLTNSTSSTVTVNVGSGAAGSDFVVRCTVTDNSSSTAFADTFVSVQGGTPPPVTPPSGPIP